MAPLLSDFSEEDAANLLCCEYPVSLASSASQFYVPCSMSNSSSYSGRFVLIPSEQQRKLLLEHEHRDFALREEILARGRGDRTFPHVSAIGNVELRGLTDTLLFEAH
jgi:hypothetical protein